MSLLRKLSLGLVMLAAVASAQPVSDVTEDGLVRVPSSRKAGVYRLPDATFAQYRRVMLLPSTVAFRKNWDRKGPTGWTRASSPPSARKSRTTWSRRFTRR
jgi:hypothetical protein